MALNLIKLCVGADSVDDLESWISTRLDERRRRGEAIEHVHTTRMVPKRAEELLAGGSLFWVIKAQVQCRQRLIDVRAFVDAEGIGRCQLVLDPEVIRTQWQPRRAFQGWRYLDAKDSPVDLGTGADGEMPPTLQLELAELGLL